jgi:hypothetical protein
MSRKIMGGLGTDPKAANVLKLMGEAQSVTHRTLDAGKLLVSSHSAAASCQHAWQMYLLAFSGD